MPQSRRRFEGRLLARRKAATRSAVLPGSPEGRALPESGEAATRVVALVVATLLVAGCTAYPRPLPAVNGVSDELSSAWKTRLHDDTGLPLMTAIRAREDNAGGPLMVYIEGDGRAWRNRREPSLDPTPLNPLGMKLAMASDPQFDTAYIGRPCQFAARQSEHCQVPVWTSDRYSQASVDAAGAAIDQLKQSNTQDVVLVGYSGGGVIAALLSRQRTDTMALITVAANLDTSAWTSHHGVSPLTGSLNPADYPTTLMKVPQLHFTGGDDTIVPPQIISRYLQSIDLDIAVHQRELEGYDHRCCWVENWPRLLEQVLLEVRVLPTRGSRD